jgi:hypothetical protein
MLVRAEHLSCPPYFSTDLSLKPRVLSLFYRTVDGKLWADLFTKLTGYTGRSFNHNWRMIPLAVEGHRHLQNPARAIFHTKGAALASLLNDVDYASGRRLFL